MMSVMLTRVSQPIYFNEHRFNVEEKRSQGRGNLFRTSSGGGLNSNRGMNTFGDGKMQRMQRPDRKDWTRERPFTDRNERPYADRPERPVGENRENSTVYPRKPVVGGAGNTSTGPSAGAAAGGTSRTSFNNNSSFNNNNHPHNHNNRR